MIGVIEQHVIARIKALNEAGALGYRLRQVKTYGGELYDQASRAAIKDVPAVWLAYNGGPFDQHTNAFDRHNARFVLLVATQNLRNEQAARHGAQGDVGVYQILFDMAGILAGWRPGPADSGIGPIIPQNVEPLSVEDSRNGRLAVYGLPFTVTFPNARIAPEVGLEIDLDDPDARLKIIHTNWDLPPTGNVGPALPDDENADATSHIEAPADPAPDPDPDTEGEDE